jgi:hypothetical protein
MSVDDLLHLHQELIDSGVSVLGPREITMTTTTLVETHCNAQAVRSKEARGAAAAAPRVCMPT